MPSLQIGSKIINVPASGSDANWAPGMVAFMRAVADQLAAIASEFDVSPRVQILTSNINPGLIITDAVFPNNAVRSFTFSYAVYRLSDTIALAESGTVTGVYNTDISLWILQHEFEGERKANGEPYHRFDMSGDQLILITDAIPGIYNSTESKLSYAAKTILVSNI